MKRDYRICLMKNSNVVARLDHQLVDDAVVKQNFVYRMLFRDIY